MVESSSSSTPSAVYTAGVGTSDADPDPMCILAAHLVSKLSNRTKKMKTPKDEDPETNEKNGRLYDKAGKEIR